MGHGHSHAHGHSHGHAPSSVGRAFVVGVTLNVAFIVVEVVAGVLAQSMALIADAAHNLSDVLGLFLAWGAAVLSRRRPTRRRTYGFRRSTILAALTNTLVLFLAVGGVAWEAIERISDAPAVSGRFVIAVAAIGVVINGVSAWMFHREGEKDLNMRAAFLHLAADAAVSFAVVIAGVVLLFTGWNWVDPVVSLVVCGVIVFSARGMLRDSLDLALDAVPPHIDPDAVRGYLEELPGVCGVHDLHIWAMSTTEVALTAHLVVEEGADPDQITQRACEHLHDEFGIHHTTLQLEAAVSAESCRLAHEEAV